MTKSIKQSNKQSETKPAWKIMTTKEFPSETPGQPDDRWVISYLVEDTESGRRFKLSLTIENTATATGQARVAVSKWSEYTPKPASEAPQPGSD